MKRPLGPQRLVALFVAGAALFGYPLIGQWTASPWRLFAVWGLLIVALALLLERGQE